jgi:hypothetical protein
MVTATRVQVSLIWEQVRSWPPGQRLSLASRLIQSLERDQTTSPYPSLRPADLIGAWKVENPPTD